VRGLRSSRAALLPDDDVVCKLLYSSTRLTRLCSVRRCTSTSATHGLGTSQPHAKPDVELPGWQELALDDERRAVCRYRAAKKDHAEVWPCQAAPLHTIPYPDCGLTPTLRHHPRPRSGRQRRGCTSHGGAFSIHSPHCSRTRPGMVRPALRSSMAHLRGQITTNLGEFADKCEHRISPTATEPDRLRASHTTLVSSNPAQRPQLLRHRPR
jgi:hypothetical protein